MLSIERYMRWQCFLIPISTHVSRVLIDGPQDPWTLFQPTPPTTVRVRDNITTDLLPRAEFEARGSQSGTISLRTRQDLDHFSHIRSTGLSTHGHRSNAHTCWHTYSIRASCQNVHRSLIIQNNSVQILAQSRLESHVSIMPGYRALLHRRPAQCEELHEQH